MANVDRVREDRKISHLQDASVAMCIGVLLLVFSGIAGLFWFAAMRSGTPFWMAFTAIQGGLGLLLTGIGFRGRRLNS